MQPVECSRAAPVPGSHADADHPSAVKCSSVDPARPAGRAAWCAAGTLRLPAVAVPEPRSAGDDRPERVDLAGVAGVAELAEAESLFDGEQHGVVVGRGGVGTAATPPTASKGTG